MTREPKTGTREWSETSINIGRGCPNDCRYCYAAANCVRYKTKLRSDWHNYTPMDTSYKKWSTTTKGNLGVCMFPTMHDFNEENWEKAVDVVCNLINRHNKVLLVTKAGEWAEKMLTKAITGYKMDYIREIIEVRVTIGSNDNEVLKFWEPGAPPFEARGSLLQWCTEREIPTSVSIEPFLDSNVLALALGLVNAVSGDVWIGFMNKMGRRVDLAGVDKEAIDKYVKPLQEFMQNSEALQFVVTQLGKLPNIKWKDSMSKWIDKNMEVGP